MKLKSNTKFGDSKLAIMCAILVADSIYRKYGYDLVITSFNDSIHSEDSLHYKDLAFDCRIRDMKIGDPITITQLIKSSLTQDFDVILEKDHIHIEYDPK